MAKDDTEKIKEILRELEKSEFVKSLAKDWQALSKMRMQTTLIIIIAVLATILLLNWGGKLTPESNGWILAALVGYLFGRGTQK